MSLAPESTLRVLREPLSRRAVREVGYLLLAGPLTVIGLVYAVVSLAVGAALAVTALGIPLISWAVPGVRWFGSLRRRATNGLLGDDIPPPDPFRPPPGFLARVSAGLRDRTGWRAIGFLLLAVPLAFAGLYVVLVTWVWGLVAFTYPVAAAFGQDRPPVLFGWVITGAGSAFALWLLGAALLLVAPWAVRAFLLLDRQLVRSLLGGGPGAAERIRDLERSRAYAIEDVAATLRRIERDLHDGVQARMVALAMNLTMLNETLGPDASDESRRMLTAALGHAKDGIAELRHMVGGIHPPALDAGLATALDTLAARSPIPVTVHGVLPSRPTEAIETIAYFSVAELLTNVTRHSGADHATVELAESDGKLVVTVTDNGHGGASTDGSGTGLRGLTERVGTVDGRLDVDSPTGGPTVITVELPLHT
ncbi:MAG TPA: sensor domain-containing protein [Pseudonocardiaceae bacterium]|nr:sensor domain-containing protein [Pseudonocardiaceae bacterium]